MKGIAVFPGKKQIELIEIAAQQGIGPSDVRLRMLEVGICGTDKEIAAFQYGTPPKGSDYLIIGHESLAEVAEIGPNVHNFSAGDLVVSMVRRPCPHHECVPCRLGRQDFCVTGDYTERGIKELHGFITESVVDEERFLFKVPLELRDIGVLVEPLTIAEKAIFQLKEVQERLPGNIQHMKAASGEPRNALVLGAGPVGLLGCMALTLEGYRTFIYSREGSTSKKASIAKAVGARYLSAQDHDLPDVAREMGSIDVVYEATGASGLAFETIKFLGYNAVFIFTGVPGRKAPIQVDTSFIMRNLVLKNQAVLGTVNAGAEAYMAAIIRLGAFMKRWPDAVRSVITGRYPIEQYADLLSGKAPGIKNVIRLSSDGSPKSDKKKET